MKREELARALAAKQHVTRAEARDTLDAMIHAILRSLRQGQPAEMPGVGSLISQPQISQPQISQPKNARGSKTPTA